MGYDNYSNYNYNNYTELLKFTRSFTNNYFQYGNDLIEKI